MDEEPGNLEADGRDKELCDRLVNVANEFYPVTLAPKKHDPPLDADPYPYDDDPEDFGRLYSYFISMDPTWNEGPCIPGKEDEDGFCYVKIAISGNFFSQCSGNKCRRRVTLNASGHVEPAPAPAEGDPIEINPFTQSQWIEIEELTVNFRGIGSSKVVASCYYDNREYDQQGNIIQGKFLKPIVFRTCVDTDQPRDNIPNCCDGPGC